MKTRMHLLKTIITILLLLLLCSCSEKDEQAEEVELNTADLVAAAAAEPETIIAPSLLPVRFRTPGYMTANDDLDDELDSSADEYQIKVGANIRSTQGPLPLRDIIKGLVKLKEMSVSWESDVNQDVLVDVDISANDNFYDAINNLLRQVDYFHEVEGSTIVIKYKETKTYRVAMPFIKQQFSTDVGGNLLGSNAEGTVGTIKLTSTGNEFEIWQNIETNLNSLIATWDSTISIADAPAPAADAEGEGGEAETSTAKASRQTSSGGTSYSIDKPVGLITVHAPRSLQRRIDSYLTTLKKELYKQIAIEAKIIEVQLKDNQSLGINWHVLLSNLNFGGGYLGGYTNYGKSTSEGYSTGNSLTNTSLNTSGSSVDKTGVSTSGSAGDTLSTSTDLSPFTNDPLSPVYGTGTDDNITIGSSTDSDLSTTATNAFNSASNTISNVLSAGATAATLITGGASNLAGAAIGLSAFNFDDFINALSDQGQTTVLSNPKISVMNGQPAMITVGRNVTYIDSIESDVDTTTGVTSYTVNTDRILSGVGLALSAVIKDDDEIIMNLVPVTSELQEPIEYRIVGGGEVGLPIVNIREMSTTVKIKNGSMLVVGGLISTVEAKDGDFIPGTENIPFFKYLFGYEETQKVKRELIILLKPRII